MMTYRGHVEKGRIVLDEPAELPEGTRVTLHVEPRWQTGPLPQILGSGRQ